MPAPKVSSLRRFDCTLTPGNPKRTTRAPSTLKDDSATSAGAGDSVCDCDVLSHSSVCYQSLSVVSHAHKLVVARLPVLLPLRPKTNITVAKRQLCYMPCMCYACNQEVQ